MNMRSLSNTDESKNNTGTTSDGGENFYRRIIDSDAGKALRKSMKED